MKGVCLATATAGTSSSLEIGNNRSEEARNGLGIGKRDARDLVECEIETTEFHIVDENRPLLDIVQADLKVLETVHSRCDASRNPPEFIATEIQCGQLMKVLKFIGKRGEAIHREIERNKPCHLADRFNIVWIGYLVLVFSLKIELRYLSRNGMFDESPHPGIGCAAGFC